MAVSTRCLCSNSLTQVVTVVTMSRAVWRVISLADFDLTAFRLPRSARFTTFTFFSDIIFGMGSLKMQPAQARAIHIFL